MLQENKPSTASIQWDENKQPVSEQYGDVYFSKENGLAESRYVFLEANRLSERFSALKPKQNFCIVETGFGTGLNFLATRQLWDEQVSCDASLDYISIEKHPLSCDDLIRSHQLWPELQHYSKQLVQDYAPQPWAQVQRIIYSSDKGSSVRLTLYFYDVQKALEACSAGGRDWPSELRAAASFGELKASVDAWFLDGFAPSKNPDMWQASLFDFMAYNSKKSTTFSTFTAAAVVKNGLKDSGFDHQKKTGFGKKRDMLHGVFAGLPETPKAELNQYKKSRLAGTQFPTWLCQTHNKNHHQTAPKIKHALVIGAGLAGAHVAHALANRGIRVRVLEKQTIASGASANFQGVVYTRLSDSNDPLSQFNRSAQLFADQFYTNNKLYRDCGERCGVLHTAFDPQAQTRLNNFVAKYAPDHRFFESLNPTQAREYAGVSINNSAVLVSQSGWLHPAKVCSHLLSHPLIEVIEHCQITSIVRKENQWVAKAMHPHDENNIDAYSAEACIICNAQDARLFEYSAHLPLSKIRGQISHCKSTGKLSNLKAVVCGEGYVCPAADLSGDMIHSVGATYNLNDHNTALTDKDHKANILAASNLFGDSDIHANTAEVGLTLADSQAGSVGFRTNTPDYFPIVGPVPDIESNKSNLASLSKKANALTPDLGQHHQGLYCSLGFGSRGLAYSPLCAEIIADLIDGRFLAIDRRLYAHLHPARFLIRALIKNKAYPN